MALLLIYIPSNSAQSEYLELSVEHNIVAPTQLQWDHADLLSFYEFTRCNLLPILDHLTSIQYDEQKSKVDVKNQIEAIYSDIVTVLNSGANLYVPIGIIKKFINFGGIKNWTY